MLYCISPANASFLHLEVEHMLWSSYVPVVQDNLPVGCLQMLVQSESPGGGEQQEEEERNNQKS